MFKHRKLVNNQYLKILNDPETVAKFMENLRLQATELEQQRIVFEALNPLSKDKAGMETHKPTAKDIEFAKLVAQTHKGFIFAVHSSALGLYECRESVEGPLSYILKTKRLPIKFLPALKELGPKEKEYLDGLENIPIDKNLKRIPRTESVKQNRYEYQNPFPDIGEALERRKLTYEEALAEARKDPEVLTLILEGHSLGNILDAYCRTRNIEIVSGKKNTPETPA